MCSTCTYVRTCVRTLVWHLLNLAVNLAIEQTMYIHTCMHIESYIHILNQSIKYQTILSEIRMYPPLMYKYVNT